MAGEVAKYVPVLSGDRLHQGEILANVVQTRPSLMTIEASEFKVELVTYPFVIILTQDCDLEQDANARQTEKELVRTSGVIDQGQNDQLERGKLPCVLFCEAFSTVDLKAKLPKGKDIWKRIVQNKDERYQCIEEISVSLDSAGQGVPSLGCDFRRFFTIRVDELYRRFELNQIQRRVRLLTPYAEHLLHRFCNFQSRIPLPESHDIPL